MGIAGLVLGIVATAIGGFFPSVGWLGLIAGIVGIILAALACKNEKASINTAGLVLSIIGTALCLVFWIACALVVGCSSAVGIALN